MKDYVEKVKEVYKISGTRISLNSVVYAFKNGQSLESIVQSFPLLTLEQVDGAIKYYLANKEDIDTYLKEEEKEYERLREESRKKNPTLYKKLAEARQHMESGS